MMTWQEWLADNTAQLTAQGYAREVRLYAAWLKEPLTPARITRVEVKAHIAHMRGDGYAPRTINRRLEGLRAFVRYGMAVGALAIDPLERVENETLPEAEIKWLERKEWGRLERELELQVNGARSAFAQATAARDAAVVYLLRYAGLRVAEVCALALEDVTLDGKPAVSVRHGKGDKPRTIPLHAEAARAVKRWLALRPAIGAALFVGKRGEALAERGVQRRIEELARRANVECTPHTLRHTFAHELVSSGAPLTVVQALLGHARLETTSIYVRPGANDLRQAVELLA